MTDAEHRARRLLGVPPGASPEEIRAAYRSLMRRHHPDVAGDDPTATARAGELAAAYGVLTGTPTPPDPVARSPVPPPDPPPHTEVRADGVIIVEAPGNETFQRVFDALESIGEITYRDRAGGYLQAMFHPAGGPLCTMVVAIEPSAVNCLVLVSVDPMDSSPTPPVEPILEHLAQLIHDA